MVVCLEDIENVANVPLVDLSRPHGELVRQIAQACSTHGFFQVASHGVPQELMDSFRHQMQLFFHSPRSVKEEVRRCESNARGYFDDELTKRRRDWKEAFDVGVPGCGSWSTCDRDASNATLDGHNRFPSTNGTKGRRDLDEFRPTVVAYFAACEELAHRIAVLMEQGLEARGDRDADNAHSGATIDETAMVSNDGEWMGMEGGRERPAHARSFAEHLLADHTSFLRLNYYPPAPPATASTVQADNVANASSSSSPPLGISPHRDAGYLTVLQQDMDCHSLQVLRQEVRKHPRSIDGEDIYKEEDWVYVRPQPGCLTINTGDMAMIHSNGKYKAPLHRVVTNPTKKRFSAPFFYNPPYKMFVAPVTNGELPLYHACLWGYYRAVRYAGDLTDLGVEIQSSDYLKNSNHSKLHEHITKQKLFAVKATYTEPFSVEKYRPLLTM